MHPLIPKKIHVTWKSKHILDNQSPVILNGLRNVVDCNPDWQLEISDDHDLESYLQLNLSNKDYRLLQYRPIVEKTDVWRLCKMFNEGGMYIDIDRYYNIPLHEILEPQIKTLLPTNQDFDFSQDFMLSAPGNPIYQAALEYNLQLRRQGERRIYLLGAQGFMLTTASIIMQGENINSDPGRETFDRIRKKLGELEFVKTYRENPPHDTMVYRHDHDTWRPGNGKDKLEFYAEFGVKHWVNS